jgi:hypothetical protein
MLASWPTAAVLRRQVAFWTVNEHVELSAVLFVEPEVLETPAVVGAVDHRCEALHVRLPAVCDAAVKNDRPRAVLHQSSLDLPHHPLALILVEFHRLPVDQLVDLGITVAVRVIFGAAGVSLVESLVGIVDRVERGAESDCIIVARNLGEPQRVLNRFQIGVDVDLFQLVDQDDRRVAKGEGIARRYLGRESSVGAVTERLHDLASVGAVLCTSGP